MNVYVETNFVLELVFQQEQSRSCENILRLCGMQEVHLFVPAYSLAEPHEKLRRQSTHRQELQKALSKELRELSRNASYTERVRSIRDIANLLVRSNEEERSRFTHIRKQILQVGTVLPLTADVLSSAAETEAEYDLSPQDALVFASIVNHLRRNKSRGGCFLNKNSRDFDSPNITHILEVLNCKMIPKFDDGYRYIQSRISHNKDAGGK